MAVRGLRLRPVRAKVDPDRRPNASSIHRRPLSGPGIHHHRRADGERRFPKAEGRGVFTHDLAVDQRATVSDLAGERGGSGLVPGFRRIRGKQTAGHLRIGCSEPVRIEDLQSGSGAAGENMFTPMELDDADYRMKPMNCPFHILIYKDSLKSYRDLPVRLGELGTVYRYERSGVMHGLLRVRGFTQDDAHIFCTPDQIEDEVVGCIDFALAVLQVYGFDKFQVELSTWDPKDRATYAGRDDQWELAQRSLEQALKRRNIEYKLIPGEAAFYGPKIDVKLVDAIGRLWQLSTVQFDFTLPERFGLEYVGEDGKRHQPLMVHRALYGSVERFFGVLIEHYAGAFPVWLSPVQVVVIPIGEKHHAYANEVGEKLKVAGVRVHVDARNEKMNGKIREHAMQKVPFQLVLGDREMEVGEVNVRVRGQEKGEGSVKADAFVERVKGLIERKSATLL